MQIKETDTIAAISSGLGGSGIGIIRISGPDAVCCADRVFRAKGGRTLAEAESHTVHYGHVLKDGKILDEVLSIVFRAPRTYTREDVVEIHCHGGTFVMQEALEAVLASGARLAKPGEFTERAFLSGRIELSQAEAVMDMIRSDNSRALRAAADQLSGAMRDKISSIRAKILAESAKIEAAMDDPEHFDLTGNREALMEIVSDLRTQIGTLLDTAEEGRILREGIATVILGRPNVGKSTLLNALAGADRAIVTDIAGTTRDVLEETVILSGIPLRIMDTAGLRSGADPIEEIGVQRARACAESADLVLYVLDGGEELSEEDRENIAPYADKPVLILLNKSDLPQNVSRDAAASLRPGTKVISLSAAQGEGLSALAEAVRELFLRGEVRPDDSLIVTNARHKEALRAASESLSYVEEAIRNEMPDDLYTVDLMDAYMSLGQITGEDVGEDLIDEIFASFCMGK